MQCSCLSLINTVTSQESANELHVEDKWIIISQTDEQYSMLILILNCMYWKYTFIDMLGLLGSVTMS